jgi:hypothetical protein
MSKLVVAQGLSKHQVTNAYLRYSRAAKRSDRREAIVKAWSVVTSSYQSCPAGTFGRAS